MKKSKERKSSSGTKEKEHSGRTKAKKQERSYQKSIRSEVDEANLLDSLSEDFDDETLQALPQSLKPIWCFIDDRSELVNEIFSTIHESSLQKMMPKVLKNYNLDQVKSMCLEQLKMMSEDHILYILTGGDPDSFVEKKPGEDVELITGFKQTEGKKRKSPDEAVAEELQNKKKAVEDAEKKADNLSPKPEEGASSDALELHASTKEEEECLAGESDLGSVALLLQQCDTSTDLELLELEMRAKAIRSLLKAKGCPSSSEEESS